MYFLCKNGDVPACYVGKYHAGYIHWDDSSSKDLFSIEVQPSTSFWTHAAQEVQLGRVKSSPTKREGWNKPQWQPFDHWFSAKYREWHDICLKGFWRISKKSRLKIATSKKVDKLPSFATGILGRLELPSLYYFFWGWFLFAWISIW